MTIAKLLGKRAVVSVGADRTVREVVALLAEHRIGAVPVLEGAAVVGIFSERDMIHALVERGVDALDLPVSERMTSPAITVDPAASVLGALSLMTQRRIRHLPVVDGDRLVGFVSIGDLVKYRIDGIEAEAKAMRDYIQQG
ncbi:hypothetical protein ASE70_02100 [Sphingomonas sp. Leaf22]|uniref:CBS domain-containing protein n=1 Tax=Sphingomonas sp. Leaf22 TaxID=1735687 RepID=UPI0007023B82|nr:CBS domain-containing protein [Sphingomonas sp. Leaf22]KQM90547.1 hypothetical protein ASE70_02100 [Sphingomonas sp. Leaf22]